MTHSEPVRADVKMSGAAQRYTLTIGKGDAGILVFPDQAARDRWKSTAISLGAVGVTFDLTAVSLDSNEAIADSATLAPKLAAALGGEAFGA